MSSDDRIVRIAAAIVGGAIVLVVLLVMVLPSGDKPVPPAPSEPPRAVVPPPAVSVETRPARPTDRDGRRREIIDSLRILINAWGVSALVEQRDGELFVITPKGDCDRKALENLAKGLEALDMHIDREFDVFRCSWNSAVERIDYRKK